MYHVVYVTWCNMPRRVMRHVVYCVSHCVPLGVMCHVLCATRYGVINMVLVIIFWKSIVSQIFFRKKSKFYVWHYRKLNKYFWSIVDTYTHTVVRYVSMYIGYYSNTNSNIRILPLEFIMQIRQLLCCILQEQISIAYKELRGWGRSMWKSRCVFVYTFISCKTKDLFIHHPRDQETDTF